MRRPHCFPLGALHSVEGQLLRVVHQHPRATSMPLHLCRASTGSYRSHEQPKSEALEKPKVLEES